MLCMVIIFADVSYHWWIQSESTKFGFSDSFWCFCNLHNTQIIQLCTHTNIWFGYKWNFFEFRRLIIYFSFHSMALIRQTAVNESNPKSKKAFDSLTFVFVSGRVRVKFKLIKYIFFEFIIDVFCLISMLGVRACVTVSHFDLFNEVMNSFRFCRAVPLNPINTYTHVSWKVSLCALWKI